MKEMVEPRLKQIRRTGIAGDVAAEFAGATSFSLVGTHYHCQRVPAHQRGQPLFNRQITGEHRLLVHGNRVLVRRAELRLPTDALCPGLPRQLVEHKARARGALGGYQRGKGVPPFTGFLRIGIMRCLRGGIQGGSESGGQGGIHGGESVGCLRNALG